MFMHLNNLASNESWDSWGREGYIRHILRFNRKEGRIYRIHTKDPSN